MSSQLRQPQQSSWLGSARACSNPLQAATPPQAAARISRRSSHSRRYQEHPHRNAPRLKSAAHLRARSSTTRGGRESAYQPRRSCHTSPPGPALMSRGNRIKKPVAGPAASIRAVTKLPRKQQR
ncbi:hypothetical protein NDU88_003764 [Pleurodeles waltl]|uniref:Uncharacterized protein n=1 Tax=Pleurodeles waltl TaxID=8319 RepID=A0AAV7KWH2_PLEWA|nr:hypothetical protein NDU88_003743 [Pleurodeles waltl]KAJ1083607.1 hypothetical protein NDU88_003764 [Pleurodeles waltl]